MSKIPFQLKGNDIAGSKTVPDPIVTPTPSAKDNTAELEEEYPGLFPSYAVKRSKS